MTKNISAEVAVYSLSGADTRELVSRAINIFEGMSLEYHTGAMSTLLKGEPDVVFEAIRRVFTECASDHDVLLRCVISNHCPV